MCEKGRGSAVNLSKTVSKSYSGQIILDNFADLSFPFALEQKEHLPIQPVSYRR
jgi:hypothetical protein